MIFAWILCASVASVVGRYFQPYWWGEKMLGSKVWVKVRYSTVSFKSHQYTSNCAYIRADYIA